MKSILVILSLLIGLNLRAQSESDSTLYQYRIGIKEITTMGSAQLIQESLYDLFETKPKFEEALQTFIFESKIDVDTLKVRQALSSTAYTEVTYFKKERIK